MSKRLSDENPKHQFQKKAKQDENQESEAGIASKADLLQQNASRVSLIFYHSTFIPIDFLT
jgi:hypothetical protein